MNLPAVAPAGYTRANLFAAEIEALQASSRFSDYAQLQPQLFGGDATAGSAAAALDALCFNLTDTQTPRALAVLAVMCE